MSQKEFFIGWDANRAKSTVGTIRNYTLMIAIILVVVSGGIAALQSTIGTAFFDFGNKKEFKGLFLSDPYPMLISETPIKGNSTILLVNEWKFGLDQEMAKSFHLKPVTIKGTLIHDDHQAMIEVVKEGIKIDNGEWQSNNFTNQAETIGLKTISGEIVDSKCWLGVMNPGSRKTHRACAILCIKGGIPPIMVTKPSDDNPSGYFLLVAPDGKPINDQVLDYVGLPAQVEGQVDKIANLFVMKIDPKSIQLLEK